MLPQIVGPGTFTPSPFAPSAAERTAQGAHPTVGETAAAATRPETANRVDPPRAVPAPLPLPENRRRGETLLPPDTDAPAGPPPAFDATPLDRLREADFAAADLIAAPPEARPEAAPGKVDPPADPDDGLRARAEAEVAEIRRMSEPDPERTLDILR